MKLYFNGCSHTFGDDLTDRTFAWPTLVANSLRCDFLNDSVSGGTNDRILYRTIKHLDDFDVFFVAWTYTSRFTRYRFDNNHEVNFNSQLRHSMYGHDPEFQNYGQLHYTVWHNELYSFKLWLQSIVLLQKLFESKNKKYIMLNACHNLIDRWTCDWKNFNNSVQSLLCFDQMNDQQLYQEHVEIQQLVSSIDLQRCVDWGTWYIEKLCINFPIGKTGHLLQDGHTAVAKHILAHDLL